MMDQNANHEYQALKRLLGAALVGPGALALTTPGSPSPRRDVPAAEIRPVHEGLQVDTNMIDQMSSRNADTGRQNHRSDQQTERSSDPGYLAALEQQEVDIHRMLTRT